MKILNSIVLTRKWWTKKRILIFGILLAVIMIMSVFKGQEQEIGTDFHAFWSVGRNFFNGTQLYIPAEGAMPFVYPPVAALVFQSFAIFPLKIAGGLFFIANIILFIASIYLIKLIFEHFYPNRPSLKWPLIFAVVLSARFFVNNLQLLQTNEIWLFLCLAAIYAFLKRRTSLSCILFVVATFMKIIPVFFLPWVIIHSRWKAVPTVILTTVICLVLPVAQRGLPTSIRDWSDYHQAYLKAFQNWNAATPYTIQNLGAAIYRMALPSENPENLNYQIISLSEDTVKLIYKLSFIAILFLFISNLVFLRIRKAPISPFEISSVFLTASLLSGITRKAHLVSLIFVLMTFLSIDYKSVPKLYRYTLWVLYPLIVILGTTGDDIVGSKIHYYMGGYSTITWTLLILLICSIWFSEKFKKFSGIC